MISTEYMSSVFQSYATVRLTWELSAEYTMEIKAKECESWQVKHAAKDFPLCGPPT